ncbi:MAG: rhomboid family intramembrane serine protease [Rhabdochlamydiaceae bacterium]|nr:rhomboid family intramembrane serine protease [Rhabdochlamydiaceae bacterium]
MRLIAEFQTEKEAFGLQIFLQNHGIKSLYDSTVPPTYRVWVVEEDDIDKALELHNEWLKNPSSSPIEPEKSHEAKPPARWKVRMEPPRLRSSFSLTNLIIVACGFLFLWMLVQMGRLEQEKGPIALDYEFVPIVQKLMFDYPTYLVQTSEFLNENNIKTTEDMKELSPKLQAKFKKIQDSPKWDGAAEMLVKKDWSLLEKLPKGTLFGKIRQGEFWRLISPVMLHGGWLHILFNMAWLFILGRQIEERLGKFRYLFLSLLLGVMSNIAQYLVSGPIFMGYSGIVVGMVGFIWMRQKKAPWEGYPLQRPVIVFVTVFVLAMLALEIISMALEFFHLKSGYANIANTAHVIGGLFGALLGRLSLFERSPQ